MRHPLRLAISLLILTACQAEDLPSGPDSSPAGPALDAGVLQSGTWYSRLGMPTGRVGVTAATVNGVVYLIGGNLAGNGGGDGGPTPTAKVESYHPNTTTLLAWRNRAPMPGARSFTNGAAVINGKIYVSGGLTINADGQYVRTRTLYRYDPVNDVWASRARLPRATSGGATVAIDGKLYAYVVYGADNSSGAALYRYDPAADAWTELATPPAIQVGAAATVLGGKMWVIGGRFGKGTALATVSVFDPGTGKWTTKPPLEMAREGLVARTIDGRIYVAGGSAGGSGAVEYLEMYDPPVGDWFVTKAVIPTPRAYAASAVVGGNLYVIGGTAGDGRTNEMYVP